MSDSSKEPKMHKGEPTTWELRMILAELGMLPESLDRDQKIYAVRSQLRRRGAMITK